MICMELFICFKQKTAYEMRISDWSSDVCSSDLAENGYPLVSRITNALQAVETLFRNEWPSSSEIYFPKAGRPKPGDLFRNPALAATYRRIIGESEAAGGDRERQIEAARAAWYEGFVAEAVDRRSEEHTSELQSLMRISYAVFCLKKKKYHHLYHTNN